MKLIEAIIDLSLPYKHHIKPKPEDEEHIEAKTFNYLLVDETALLMAKEHYRPTGLCLLVIHTRMLQIQC